MKNLFVILFISIFLLSFISATDNFGTFSKNEVVQLKQVCYDATYINISSISYPNSSVVVSNIEMISSGSGEFYYNFNSTNVIGRYSVVGISDGCENTFSYYFYIGEPLSVSIAIFYGIILLSLIIFIVLSINKIFTSYNQLWIIFFSILSYFLILSFVFIVLQISEKYLYELIWITQLLNILFVILLILLFPFIIGLFVYLFFNMFNSKQISKMTSMGYTQEEAQRMRKR